LSSGNFHSRLGIIYPQRPRRGYSCSEYRVTLLRRPLRSSSPSRYVTDRFRSLVVSLAYSRLESGNFVLVGLPAYLQGQLQSILNAAARLVFRIRRYDHVTDALASLHWLRLPFQGCCLGISSAARACPTIPEPVGSCRRPSRPSPTSLVSSASYQLHVPSFRLSTVGRRSFPVAATITWKSLPSDVQSPPSLSIFRRHLKTFLFRKSFPNLLL